MEYQPDNIFAKILRNEAPSYKVYEDDATYVMMDIMPESRGHLLVLPKEGAVNIFDISDEAIAACAKTCKKIAPALMKATKADGLIISQFNHAPAGQTVFHLHCHLVPVYEGQSRQSHGRVAADADELQALAKEIASYIE
ncbi:HIT family protein [Oligella urethralis]|uniref:Purine nucleoside phosphoramidase n=1 Tax=Oligella urethralis TaxID=90245 RepID=A0A2N6QAX8_9BURK|nr:HIT domain-containing protein [Oligella urethralis]MDK6202858.1 HIT domain-containing protein [Oligella urethralis]PMC16649.1 HIT domain-containing protein [Oligella urethralis]SPY08996.1 purine nucleoside phosphoramidase [Oligella urethralis]SUA52097.1 purine nucleoside phosphoramidase [Oligella urethralis]SUA56164.1 purine nucleoside phosphoramidase [Oligella urethralis]